MQLRSPFVAGLGIAVLVGTADARAQDAASDDQYNYISGLFEKGFHDLVVSEARRFLAANGGHARAPLVRYRLGQSLFELKRFADARAELQKLEPPPRDFPYSIEVSFRLGQCALETNDPAEAARRFDAITSGGGDHYLVPAAAFHSGEAHFRAGEFASAAKAYGRAVKGGDAEYAKNALHGLGWALYKAGEFETAANGFELFARRFPQDPAAGEAQFLLGECRLKQGKAAEAIAALQKVPPGEWLDDALLAAGFACAELGDDAKAAQWFLRLEQAAPESSLLAEARLHAGLHFERAGRDDDAAAVLDRLLAGDAGGFAGEACYRRGLVERKRRGAKAAVPYFERGLSSKPEKELAQRLALARADALFDAGDFDAAKEAYARAGGGSEEAVYSAAVAALNGGDFKGASERARDFLARYAKGRHAPDASLVLGEALFAQERFADALPAFEQAAQPGDDASRRPRALSRGGWCCFKLGRFADAAQRFAALAAEFPKDERAAEAAFMAGRSFLRGGDAKAAEAALAQFVQQRAASEWSDDARYDLVQCKRALGKQDEAQRLLTQLARGGERVDPALARRAALESAEAHAAANHHEEALAAIEPIVGGDAPADSLRPALYAQAWSLFALKRLDEASAALSRLFSSETPNAPLPKEIAAPALELAVSLARARKDGAGARAAYEKLVRLAPDGERTPETALVAALALDEGGDARAAAALLEDATRRWPQWSGRDRLAYQRALSLRKSGDEKKAAALLTKFEKELSESPLAAQAAFALGEQAYAAGDFDGALTHYARAAADGSPVADAALYKSGWCQFQKERFAEAAAAFAQVALRFEKSPLAGESRLLAGESHYRAGAFERAAETLAEFLKLHPRHELRAKGLFRLGLACGELSHMDECADALTKLEREFPDFELKAESDLWLGRALLAKKRTNDALSRFDAVIQADRGVLAARAHLGRGDALLAQGRLDDALGEYLKVSLLFSSEPEVARSLWLAGQCLEQMGDPEKAKARYRELVGRHAQAPEAEQARARLKELESTKGS